MGTTSSQYEDTVNFTDKRKGPTKKKAFVKDHADASTKDDEPTNAKSGSKSLKKPKIEVDQIDQEQARQDLMAYLEIVGENADDLPLTWRDDPELGRSVSSLTAKQYATKADAFIPCDVRVISTTCTRYGGSTWTLPNKENFYLGERAQDPGLSLGGAVSNSLLKVIYDFESDAMNPAPGGGGDDDAFLTENLFDDDDDDNADENLFDDDEDSFGSLQFDGMMSGATLSWSELLRRMKDEMEALDYAQVPTICSSRRFDLDEPVYLLPPNFDPSKNRKFSLLIGCNYKKEVGSLQKSHDDIHMVKDYIVNVFGFPEDEQYMTILIDEKKYKKPTYKNILQAMKFIALRSRPGDAVFIQFSGHGGRVLDLGTRTADCYDEVIVPSDFQKKGFITDKALFKSLLVPMAEDVTVTIILDSCDTGVMLDLPYTWGTKDDDLEAHAKLALNDSFSFMRLLDVVKQLYDSSVGEPGGIDDDEDSIVTTGDNDDDSDSDDDSLEDEVNGSNDKGGISAKAIMSKIGDTFQVMAEEAEHTSKTAMKMYELLMEQNEKRKVERKGENEDNRDEIDSHASNSFSCESGSYSSEEGGDSVYSTESEDSYAAKVRSSQMERKSKKKSTQRRGGRR